MFDGIYKGIVELVEVTEKQAAIIDDLFQMLLQHVEAKELEDITKRIGEVAKNTKKDKM